MNTPATAESSTSHCTAPLASSSTLAAPEQADLYALWRLCGTPDKVVHHIARSLSLVPSAIAPTVKQWLAELPEVPPPSRQRSAPAVLAPSMQARLVAAATPLQQLQRGQRADVLRLKTPPASAPALPGARDVTAAMRALDARLNRTARNGQWLQSSSQFGPLGQLSNRSQRLETHAAFAKALPPSVREESFGSPSASVHAPAGAPTTAYCAWLAAQDATGGSGPVGVSLDRVPAANCGAPAGTHTAAFQSWMASHVADVRDMSREEHDDALAAFMERARLVHGQGRLMPSGPSSATKEGMQSTWMTRGISKAAL